LLILSHNPGEVAALAVSQVSKEGTEGKRMMGRSLVDGAGEGDGRTAGVAVVISAVGAPGCGFVAVRLAERVTR
jgi:hypothetical protein